MALISLKMLLNTAIKRLINKMLATNKYMAITNGVTHRPVWQCSMPEDSSHTGYI